MAGTATTTGAGLRPAWVGILENILKVAIALFGIDITVDLSSKAGIILTIGSILVAAFSYYKTVLIGRAANTATGDLSPKAPDATDESEYR